MALNSEEIKFCVPSKSEKNIEDVRKATELFEKAIHEQTGLPKHLVESGSNAPLPMMDKDMEAMVSMEYLDNMRAAGFLEDTKPSEQDDGTQ